MSLRHYRILALALTFLLVGALSAKEIIKVGVVAPFTGSMSFLGEGTRDGLEMKLKELGSSGKFEYKIIYEDDGYVFSRTANAVKKLKDIDHVDVMITLWGYGSSIALPILKGSSIVHLSAHRWDNIVQEFDYAVGESVDQQASKVIELMKTLNYKKVVYIGTAEQGSEVMRKAFQESFPKAGVTLEDEIVVSADVRDFRTAILKIQDKKPDAIVEILTVPSNGVFMRQLHEMNDEIPVIHTSSTIFEADPRLVEGSCTVYPTPPTIEWQKRFLSDYKREQKYPAPQAYNTIELLVRACERLDGAKKPTAKQLAESIESLREFEGATGSLYFVGPNRYEAPVAFWLFRNGKPEVVTLEELSKLKEGSRAK